VWRSSLTPGAFSCYNTDTPAARILTSRPWIETMYIDPTTGSLVLQFLAAGILSVLAMVSRVREAFKSFFKLLIPRRRR